MGHCRACALEKPESEFYSSDRGRCKECTRAAVRANRVAKGDYYRAYDRLRHYESGRRGNPSRAARKRAQKSWSDGNPEKRRAHSLMKQAVDSGAMKRPSHCSECAKPCKPHGHHDDYNKPLDVRWLCSTCHRAWHRKYDEVETRALVEQHRNSA